ncbi:CBS domain-containing protein [Kushneria phyllosphaerae]|uniref:Glycine betaine/carnitine/choline transport ATP-binding protein OpuCA n=1 Tax=Kushneria phyllosphaerae TaxID=2100822 RepID=A0A2R8CLX6_9GAMM|nr:CBS domain-containing protein [Kushneria phyllosphaerae]SPJ33907.1 Glycine betaine/carnitine/choline transport ATP-binding protein OpuCA [Kushneria phyllosphaerae]
MTSSEQATVANIMSREVVTLRLEQTLHDGNELMREHRIRHLPVLDEQGHLVGLLDQKVVLKEALRIADNFGSKRLSHHLKRISLNDVISREVLTLSIDTPLVDAGQKFLAHRQGALPVLDAEGHLVGILSSVDFVRLAVALLDTSSS